MRSHQLLGGLLVWMTLSTVTTFAAAINVNGTCEVGTCTPPDLLAMGDSVSVPFSFVYTFANTDQYRGTGTVAASNTSDTNGLVEMTAASITLTYLGNSSGTLSSADTLVIEDRRVFCSKRQTLSPGLPISKTSVSRLLTGRDGVC
jgi:hypothetical protein